MKKEREANPHPHIYLHFLTGFMENTEWGDRLDHTKHSVEGYSPKGSEKQTEGVIRTQAQKRDNVCGCLKERALHFKGSV